MAGDDDGLSNAQAYFTQSADVDQQQQQQQQQQQEQQYLGLNHDQGKHAQKSIL